MTNRQKYIKERNDAIESLWLLNWVEEVDMDIHPTIFFPYSSGEDISLAKAVYDVNKKEKGYFAVIIEHNGTFFLLDWQWLNHVRVKGNPVFCFRDDNEILGTNIARFWKYTDNKLLASMILNSAWIMIPRQIAIKQSRFYPVFFDLEVADKDSEELRLLCQLIHEQTFARVMTFLDSHDIEKFVTKPHDWAQGDWVTIHHTENFQEQWAHEDMFGDSDMSQIMLVQEKIEPYTLVNRELHQQLRIDQWLTAWWEFSDWNMRVLVTYDATDLTSGRYIPVGIVCRIDEVDKPVNISISASYDTFDTVMERCWLNGEKEILRKKIEDAAVQATVAIVNYCDKKSKRPKDIPEYQVLAWVDIILDRYKNPIVIEVNAMNSGCNYELMKLEWIESLYPIGRAIIWKARLNVLINTIQRQVVETHGIEWLTQLIDGSAKLQLEEI